MTLYLITLPTGYFLAGHFVTGNSLAQYFSIAILTVMTTLVMPNISLLNGWIDLSEFSGNLHDLRSLPQKFQLISLDKLLSKLKCPTTFSFLFILNH